ncbi:MAG: hypothetical protein ACJAZP_000428 [Psychromonas sp.]|jgi:hypothetical protein
MSFTTSFTVVMNYIANFARYFILNITAQTTFGYIETSILDYESDLITLCYLNLTMSFNKRILEIQLLCLMQVYVSRMA